MLYTATNVAGISFDWPFSLEPQHSSFMFTVFLYRGSYMSDPLVADIEDLI